MPCCFTNGELFTLDSTKLCDQCKVEFYLERYKFLTSPYYHGNYVDSVWHDRITHVFRGIKDKTNERLLAIVKPELLNYINVNDRTTILVEKIISRFQGPNQKKIVASLYKQVDLRVRDTIYKKFITNYVGDNLNAAKEACRVTRDILKRGVGNWLCNPLDSRNFRPTVRPIGGIVDPLDTVGQYIIENFNRTIILKRDREKSNEEKKSKSIKDPIEILRTYAAAAKASKIGNCGEHAIIVFLHLLDNHPKVRPIKVVNVKPDHAYVIIRDMEDIIDYYVICDAYFDQVYLRIEGLRSHQICSENQYDTYIEVDENNAVVESDVK